MPEDEKNTNVLEFTGNPETQTVSVDPVPDEMTEGMQALEEAVGAKDEPKEFEWKGVKFPSWCKNPHFVDIKGSAVMAIDNDAVTMEMKANWEAKYRPILAELGKKVIEKALNIKIETL